MALIPKSQRERWRAELEKATPLPWSVAETPNFGHDHAPYTVADERDVPIAECYTPGKRSLAENEANAAIIASAPTAISALLAENDELRRMVREAIYIARRTGALTDSDEQDIAELAREVEE